MPFTQIITDNRTVCCKPAARSTGPVLCRNGDFQARTQATICLWNERSFSADQWTVRWGYQPGIFLQTTHTYASFSCADRYSLLCIHKVSHFPPFCCTETSRPFCLPILYREVDFVQQAGPRDGTKCPIWPTFIWATYFFINADTKLFCTPSHNRSNWIGTSTCSRPIDMLLMLF